MNSSSPYTLNWLDLNVRGFGERIAIGALPGCRHRFIARSFMDDLDVILSHGIKHAFIMCDNVELDRFGAPNIVAEFNAMGIRTEQFPCEFGLFPAIQILLEIIRKIRASLEKGEKCIIISRDGLGRSCVVGSAFLLHFDENLSYSDVYDQMKRLVGPRAVATVKQYNFLVDFRILRDEHEKKSKRRDNIEYFFERRLSR